MRAKHIFIGVVILATWVFLWFYTINTGRAKIKKDYIESVKEASLKGWQIDELKVKYYSDGIITFRESEMLKALKRNQNNKARK